MSNLLPLPEEPATPMPLQGFDVCNAENQPLMQLRPVAHAQLEFDAPNEPQLDAPSIARLNALLAAAPPAATAFATHAQQLLTCSFDYSKLIQANDGSGAIGAVFKEGTRQIGAQARFHEATQLKSVVNTSLLVSVASQVLAQKHLADINERLKSIEEQVKGIQEFLEQSRSAKILTFQEHLQRIGAMLSQGENVLESSLQVLAHKAQDVRAEVTHIRHDLEKAQTEVKNFDSSSWFGSNDLRAALQVKVRRISHLQREYLLGMQCLVLANLILFIKNGGNKEFVHAGNTYLSELKAPNGLLAQWAGIQRQVAVHLSKMKPVFELSKSTQANVQMVESSVQNIERQLQNDTVQVEQLQQRLLQAQTPSLLLKVESGKVISGHYLTQ